MEAINLDTYSLSLLTAKEDILNSRASTDWALFTYDGATNNLKLFNSGTGGLVELVEKFHIAKPMYGLCSHGLTEAGEPRIVMICWVGEDVDEYRQTECASHVPAVKSFFKEAQAFINASNKEELTAEKIETILATVRPPMERSRRNSRTTDKEETVGTNYRKTNAALEIKRINRDSFWARAEREEEERKEEEKKRAAEERRRIEKERILQENKEAEEREKKMNEKLQMIEEQKRMEALAQDENRKKEKTQWELQQREHEEEMRARLRRSESIEKAAEAAALISQRSMNPREFFRQLSSSSQNSTSPASPRSGKPPFRRYQRSLTDTAFIFERSNSTTSGPTSPLSPFVTSPFSRTATSPSIRPMSPSSPSFRPITSPKSHHVPRRSPPMSPVQRSGPPVSSPPNVPDSKPPPPQFSLPVLPVAQVSDPPISSGLAEDELSSLNTGIQEIATNQDAPIVPTGAQTESPVRFKELHSEPKEEVLVEEDEEEEELPAETNTISLPHSENKAYMPHLEASIGTVASPLIEEEEPEDDKEPGVELAEDTGEFGLSVDQARPEAPGSEVSTLVELSEEQTEADITVVSEISVAVSKTRLIEEDRPDQNGTLPQNGTGKEYDDCSDPGTPERFTYVVNREETDEEGEEALDNDESPGGSSLLCVRALYDYQAEDDTEISFEPGDIISEVETVDKAWWSGFSKDGRRGLFPANYVETI
ncbi:drebrin-like protein [Trichomycterus rosablanca]|uniref:drebrin-like protein n=1 Tax=Trichomycterus rosablanca TaxID=2290929 RepID=UPI002F35EF3D